MKNKHVGNANVLLSYFSLAFLTSDSPSRFKNSKFEILIY